MNVKPFGPRPRRWLGRVRAAVPAVVAVLVVTSILAGCDDYGTKSAAEYREAGARHLDEGRLNEAVIELRNAMREEPEAVETRRLLGIAYHRTGDMEAAVRHLEHAVGYGLPEEEVAVELASARFELGRFSSLAQIDAPPGDHPRLADYLAYRAIGALVGGQLDEGRALLEEARAADEAAPAVWMARAYWAVAEGDRPEGMRLLERAVAEAPEYGPPWSLLGELRMAAGDLEGAEEALSQAVTHRAVIGPDLLTRAGVRIRLGRLNEAREDLTVLSRVGAENPRYHYIHGLYHLHREDHGEARRSFAQALAVDRRYAPAMLQLGAVHLMEGNLAQAEHFLERHLVFTPRSMDAMRLLTRVYLAQDRYDEARQLLERSAQEVGHSAELLEMLARVHLAGGDAEEGMAILDAGLQRYPEAAGLHESMGLALLEQGAREAGLDALRRASDLDAAPREADRAVVLGLLQGGDFADALERSRAYRKKHPENVEAIQFEAAALMGLNRFEEARAVFEEALALEPERFSIHMNLAGVEVYAGRPDEARRILKALQEDRPGHVPSALQLARLELAEGRPGAAAAWLQGAVKNDPAARAPALMLARLQADGGDPESAMETLRGVLEHHPGSVGLTVAMADLERAMGRSDVAADRIEILLEEQPDHLPLLRRLARLQEEAGDAVRARETLERLIRLEPNDLEARLNRVRLDMQLGRREAAEADLAQLRRDFAQRPEALQRPQVDALEGALALHRGDYDTAVAHYARALEERSVRAWVVDYVHALDGAGRPQEGVDVLWRWLEAHPGDRPVWHLLASRVERAGDLETVEQIYQRILELQPDDVVALNNLAWLLRARDSERALELAGRAHDLAPESGAVMDTLAVVLFYNGEYERAEVLLRKVVERHPEAAAPRFHLARTLRERGRHEEARSLLQGLLEDSADFSQREAAKAMLEAL